MVSTDVTDISTMSALTSLTCRPRSSHIQLLCIFAKVTSLGLLTPKTSNKRKVF